MSNKSKIEICANSVESAVKAQQAGAYRVELCAGIPEGGTTPSFGEIRMARQLLNQTKLHVIIRPRGGDFLYSPIEQEIMLHDIKVFVGPVQQFITVRFRRRKQLVDLVFLYGTDDFDDPFDSLKFQCLELPVD